MERLPKDDLFNIAVNLNLEDLLSLCKTLKHINNNLCRRDDIWLHKIKKSFPTLEPVIMNKYRGDRSWKQYYIQDLYPTLQQDPNSVLINSSKDGRSDLVAAALDLSTNGSYKIDDVFIWASNYGHLDVVKLLIDYYGADVRANKNEAVRNAIYRGDLDMVKYLTSLGALDVRN